MAWLLAHYSKMSNEDLAVRLTEMIREDNEVRLAALKLELEGARTSTEKFKVIARIRTLQDFKGVTANYVRRLAVRMGDTRKSAAFIANCNKEKAMKRHWGRLIDVAVSINSYVDWFRTFSLGEKRVGRFDTPKQLTSFRSSLSQWNKGEGRDRGLYLVAEYSTQYLMAKITATEKI